MYSLLWPPGRGVKLNPKTVLAIESTMNQRTSNVEILQDGWTAVTIDLSRSAHFEHSIAIADNGPEILSMI